MFHVNLHLLRQFETKSDGGVNLIHAVYKVKQCDLAVITGNLNNATGCNLNLIVFTTQNSVVQRMVCNWC